jgi:hypothetical protein
VADESASRVGEHFQAFLSAGPQVQETHTRRESESTSSKTLARRSNKAKDNPSTTGLETALAKHGQRPILLPPPLKDQKAVCAFRNGNDKWHAMPIENLDRSDLFTVNSARESISANPLARLFRFQTTVRKATQQGQRSLHSCGPRLGSLGGLQSSGSKCGPEMVLWRTSKLSISQNTQEPIEWPLLVLAMFGIRSSAESCGSRHRQRRGCDQRGAMLARSSTRAKPRLPGPSSTLSLQAQAVTLSFFYRQV